MNKDLKKEVSELVAIAIENSSCDGDVSVRFSVNFSYFDGAVFNVIKIVTVGDEIKLSYLPSLFMVPVTIENIQSTIEEILGVEK